MYGGMSNNPSKSTWENSTIMNKNSKISGTFWIKTNFCPFSPRTDVTIIGWKGLDCEVYLNHLGLKTTTMILSIEYIFPGFENI